MTRDQASWECAGSAPARTRLAVMASLRSRPEATRPEIERFKPASERPAAVALLVLLSRATRTGIVPPDLGHGRGGAAHRAQRAVDRRSNRGGRGDPPRGSGEQVVGPGRLRLGGGGARRARGSGRGGSALTWILKKRSVKVDWMSCIRSSNISKASRLYSTSGSFWPQARYWMAFRSWSRS